MKRPYPLEALSRIRAHETTLRTREKAELTEDRRRAERKLTEAVKDKEAEQRRLFAATEAEAKRLGSGRARAGDLVQSERFRSAGARRVVEREEALGRAARIAAEAGANEQHAASALVVAHAAEKSISEHRARFRKTERRAADHREEDTVEDTLRSRPGQRGRRG